MYVFDGAQPRTATAEGRLDAARDTVKKQVSAKSLANIMCGFAENGTLIQYANLDHPQHIEDFPEIRYEIRHYPTRITTSGGPAEVTVCYIVATDGDTYKVSSGIVGEDTWHPIAMDHSFLAGEAGEHPDCHNVVRRKVL